MSSKPSQELPFVDEPHFDGTAGPTQNLGPDVGRRNARPERSHRELPGKVVHEWRHQVDTTLPTSEPTHEPAGVVARPHAPLFRRSRLPAQMTLKASAPKNWSYVLRTTA